MSTRSMIAMLNEDKTVTAIYCHFDGYVQGVGVTLLNHWNTTDRVRSLMELGDLSSLGIEVGQKQDFSFPTSRDWCLAYGRDRCEAGTEAQSFHSLYYVEGAHGDVDYFYFFDGRDWSFKRNGYRGGYTNLNEYVSTELLEAVA